MKILIDARLYGLENAGLGRYVINLINSLVNLKTEDNFVVLLRSKYYKELNLPGNWRKIKTDINHYSFKEQIVIPFVLMKEKPDISHFPHFNVPVFFFGRYVVTIHDLLMHNQKGLEATTLNPFAYYIKRLGYRLIFDRAIYGSRHIIVPSNKIKKDITQFYGISDKIEVTYEGVDSKFTQYSNRTRDIPNEIKSFIDKSPYLIYVGNAYPHKNLKMAINSVVKLSKEIDIKLVIVSTRNVFSERIQKYINIKNASNVIKVINYVDDQTLFSLMSTSLAFIFPSLSEGFGLPGLEAISAKTLLLASNIDVFREIYKDSALYFDPNSVESIKNKIYEAIIMEGKQRSKIIASYPNVLKLYSWDKMAKETYKIYLNEVKSINEKSSHRL